MEVDGGFEVFGVAEAAGAAFDRHDFAVQALGHGVGDEVRAVGDDVLQSPLDHPGDLLHRLQAAAAGPLIPLAKESLRPARRLVARKRPANSR